MKWTLVFFERLNLIFHIVCFFFMDYFYVPLPYKKIKQGISILPSGNHVPSSAPLCFPSNFTITCIIFHAHISLWPTLIKVLEMCPIMLILWLFVFGWTCFLCLCSGSLKIQILRIGCTYHCKKRHLIRNFILATLSFCVKRHSSVCLSNLFLKAEVECRKVQITVWHISTSQKSSQIS